MPNVATAAAGYSPQVPTWKQQNQTHFYNGAVRYTVYANMDAASRQMEVSRSNDGGATWAPVGGFGPALFNAVDGLGFDLTRETFCPVQVGAVLHIFYAEAARGLVSHVTFTMGPDAWGAPDISAVIYYGWYLNPGFIDGGNFFELIHACVRPGGTFLTFFHGEETNIAGSIAPNIWWMEFNPAGAVWGAPVRLNNQNGGAIAEGNSRPYAVSDGTLVHVFWRKIDVGGGLGPAIAHRSIDAAGVMGNEQIVAPCQSTATLVIGRPVSFSFGGTQYVACPYTFSSRIRVIWSTAVANPVWSVELAQTAAIPNQADFPWPSACLFNNGCLYCFWMANRSTGTERFSGSVKWLCDLAIPWRSQTDLFDDATPLRRIFQAMPELRPATTTIDVVYSGDTSAVGSGFVASENALDLAPFACPCGAGPAPAVTTVTQTGGTKRMVILVPNKYDHCLYDARGKSARIPHKSKCCIDPYVDFENWSQVPAGATAFRKSAGIATPAPVDGDVVVLDFYVPYGYDGYINGNSHVYTGPGFVEGSGDIIWRIRVSNVYVRHLGNVVVTLGSIVQTHPIEDGIHLRSRSRVQYIVNVPNLSGGILIGASRIVCVLEGWFVPRR